VLAEKWLLIGARLQAATGGKGTFRVWAVILVPGHPGPSHPRELSPYTATRDLWDKELCGSHREWERGQLSKVIPAPGGCCSVFPLPCSREKDLVQNFGVWATAVEEVTCHFGKLWTGDTGDLNPSRVS
jgi:hypothetical protein